MKTFLKLVCLSLLLTTVGSVARREFPSRPVVHPQDSPFESEELARSYEKGRSLFQGGHYLQAASLFEKSYRIALDRGSGRSATRFQMALANVRFKTFQYRDAMEAYLEARRMAAKAGETELTGALSINISSLYARMGAVEEAVQEAQQALAAIPPEAPSKYRSDLLTLQATLHAGRDDMKRAVPLFYQAISEADRQGSLSKQAFVWDQLGFELLRKNRIEEAETPLVTAFRLRKITSDHPPDVSYRNLGLLRLAQGRPQEALQFLNRAISAAKKTASQVPIWSLYYRRAQAHRARGDLWEAYQDLEAALRYARDWRVAVVPADAVRTTTTVGLQQLYSSAVETGNILYFKTGRKELARQTFEAAEENRATGLRETLGIAERLRRSLPSEYWELLAQLLAAESSLLQQDTPATREAIGKLRLQLTEIEARKGIEAAEAATLSRPALLEKVQASLAPAETLFSFHLGEADSYVWAITSDDFDVHRLPARDRIARRVAEFREAVKASRPDCAALGAALYRELFGGVRPGAIARPNWLLVLDRALFEAPLAALVEDFAGQQAVYVVERHSLRLLPSAALIQEAPSQSWSGPLLGIGDPIYNSADPRWVPARGGPSGPLAKWFRFGAKESTVEPFQLPRLAGSEREIAACAGVWSSGRQPPILLTGNRAIRKEIDSALAQQPSILHFATHVVQSPQHAREGVIALGLRPGGEAEFLGTTAVSTMRVNARLVVMSGCSSGLGEALPGEGLFGLTRAWLMAGAEAVAATQWPTPDDSGELLQALYRHLSHPGGSRAQVSADQALQKAQAEMLHSGTWRSQPGYWAAYFVVRKN